MAFSDWKTEAVKHFPELRDDIADYDSPYLLWFKLLDAFFNAYEHQNEALIKQIYEYSDWCIDQPQGKTAEDDLVTCVAVCFYERIPESRAARDDMPRWFTLSDILGMEKLFRANISNEDFEALKQGFGNPAK